MSIAVNEFRFSVVLNQDPNMDPKEHLNKYIDFLLTLLPKGTKVVEIIHKPITCLSLDIDIYLEHPFFEGIKDTIPPVSRVEIDYVRIGWLEIDETFTQEPLFVGVRYLTADGRDRFKI